MFKDTSVSVIGVGNIGSQTALALTRLGIYNLHLYDHDKVEEHNLASQSFSVYDLGRDKVEALKETLLSINKELDIEKYVEKYEGDELFTDILIVAVDTMEARKTICKKLKKNNIKPDLVVDGRMGGSQLEVYTYTDLENWEKTFSDNPSQDPCGGRYICYVSMTIGSFIANQIKRFLKGEEYKKQIIFDIDSYDLIC